MFERLLKVFDDIIGEEHIPITEATIMTKDLDLSSLDLMELIAGIETEFDIEIADKELKSLISVSDVIRCIESKI